MSAQSNKTKSKSTGSGRRSSSVESMFMSDSFTGKSLRWPSVILRVTIGLMFLNAAIPKVSLGGEWSTRLAAFAERMAPASYDFYSDFLKNVVGTNPELFGFLVTYGELFVGIALVIGLTTRLAAAAGIFMVANFLFAKGTPLFASNNNDVLFIIALAVVFLNSAGRSLGVDYFLNEKHPHVPFW